MECVILAAGEGTRMRPLTARRPKVMIPIANRPILEHLLIAARDAGITDFVLVVGYGEKEIRNHFGDGSAIGTSIRYVTQRHQRGTADALAVVSGMVDGTFLLLNGDMVLESADIRAICGLTPPVLAIYPSDHPMDFGVVAVVGEQVTGLEEKSSHPKSDLINAGAYLLTSEVFDLVARISPSPRGEYELTDALGAWIRENRLAAYRLASWLDIGYPWDLLDANASLLAGMTEGREGAVEEGVSIHGNVSIGTGSRVLSGTYIEGPCAIGKDCRIGPHAYIRGATSIGDRCHIGHASEIKNSIVMAGTKIPHFNYIGDSVVGSGCNFGAGTKVANLRHDRAPVRVCGKDSRKVKFGAIIGDDVSFGINCSVNAGTVVGSSSRISPHSYLDGCIHDGTTIL
ncbi:MAG: NTP transferase domain-containing protein [Methanoregulaceae archaeon]|nr:NTP transferase domain-containing protein [Methanoregulaceae archaeon]